MMEEIYISSTLAFCKECNKSEQARIIARNGKVYLERMCPNHGVKSSKIADSSSWYMKRMSEYKAFHYPLDAKDSREGCPKDCGLCTWHSNTIILPVFSITNDCNLNCPKCFTYNRQDARYYKSVADTKKIISQIVSQSGGVQLINLTGGEPTLHPELFDIIDACRHSGISRITMNTNGIRIAQDKEFARRIKEAGVQLAFSLDTLDPETSKVIYGVDITGQKKQALETMEELDIPVTLLSVAVKNFNEAEIARIASVYLKKEFVRSMTIQNMTFTGLNGSKFEPREHITIDEVENALTAMPEFSGEDFFPLASYHPLCYSVAYYYSGNNVVIPLTKLMEREKLVKMTEKSYIIMPEGDFSKEFLDGINSLWAEGADDKTIRSLKNMVSALYPPDREVSQAARQQYFEKYFKMIYIHPHMDEDNFDIDRVSRCGDIVPDEHGAMVPACSYNLLYRQNDSRFWVQS